MCNKRIVTLKRLVERPPKPVQTVTPEPAIPLQPVTKHNNPAKVIFMTQLIIYVYFIKLLEKISFGGFFFIG